MLRVPNTKLIRKESGFHEWWNRIYPFTRYISESIKAVVIIHNDGIQIAPNSTSLSYSWDYIKTPTAYTHIVLNLLSGNEANQLPKI